MINKLTLGIEGVKMTEESTAKMHEQFNVTLIYTLICAGFGFLSELTFTIILPSDHGQKHNVHLMVALSASSVIMGFVGWLLSSKFDVHFTGFSVIIAILMSVLKFEGMLSATFTYEDLSATYF